MNEFRCECPTLGAAPADMESGFAPEELKAMNHAPNECPGDYHLALYERGGKQIWLCSCCCILGRDTFIQALEVGPTVAA